MQSPHEDKHSDTGLKSTGKLAQRAYQPKTNVKEQVARSKGSAALQEIAELAQQQLADDTP